MKPAKTGWLLSIHSRLPDFEARIYNLRLFSQKKVPAGVYLELGYLVQMKLDKIVDLY